jgi:hypothetical protein
MVKIRVSDKNKPENITINNVICSTEESKSWEGKTIMKFINIFSVVLRVFYGRIGS